MSDTPLSDTDKSAEQELNQNSEAEPVIAALPEIQNQVFDNLRQLVREKTRFGPHDILLDTESDDLQDYTLQVTYELDARLETRDINGFFSPGSSDIKSEETYKTQLDAGALSQERLKLAGARIAQQLGQADVAYNAIPDELYLGHVTKHWHLDTCSSCNGKGKNVCYSCHGGKTETCHRCSGAGRITCTAYTCNGSGQINCSVCFGQGTVSESSTVYETVQVPYTTYSNGSSNTQYRTETRSRLVTKQRSCHHCSFGRVPCYTCSSTGRIMCPPCHGSGIVDCATCSGVGTLICKPCSGSGKTGKAAWVDVYATPRYDVALPASADQDALAIFNKINVATTADLSELLGLHGTQSDLAKNPGILTARYEGKLRIVRLDATCNGEGHHIVAYGKDLRWHTLDNIIEKLLTEDLQVLGKALNRSADDGLFSAHVGHLLEALRDVAASDLNAEVIEAVLDSQPDHSYAAILSADYVSTMQTCVLGALRHVYTRLAKQFWWKVALAALIVSGSVWSMTGAVWATLAGLATVGGGYMLFARKVRHVLTTAFNNVSRADRAIAIAGKGNRQRYAQVIILAPAILVVLGLGHFLPFRGFFSGGKASALDPAVATVAGAAAQPAVESRKTDQTYAAALKLYDNDNQSGDKVGARVILESLVKHGDESAVGLYGWMVLFGQGLPGNPVLNDNQRQEQSLQARQWIDRGLARNDPWATTAKGLLMAQGWNEPMNMPRAMEYLKQAAGQGNVMAMHFLGLYNVQGFHMTHPNFTEARVWFTRAADLAHAEDIYNIGLMDWNGSGINRPDHVSAMNHFRAAAAMGEERAVKAVSQGHP